MSGMREGGFLPTGDCRHSACLGTGAGDGTRSSERHIHLGRKNYIDAHGAKELIRVNKVNSGQDLSFITAAGQV